ncbi:LuxR C-terminal-related transcriptional regulator [Actinomadura sp. DC4]|uniref:LuxR C-terminal-related transcriptional regulator n=1 Tax=Actinomadura sp. DC4 TaxID=3055069 RepID=UPI0025B11C6F|nr:LuxR C-terminal-related transcriptional regulator [Actinomadura sp. DC4]MDN3356439.1 LuxR C-terminal-related transcriptional regulator [Actinomadura sp. DC4]
MGPESFSAWSYDGRPNLELDATAESVYQSVLENPGVSTEKLAELMALSEVTVQFALEHLARLELVACGAGDDGWTAVEPETGLAALLARQQAELARHQQQVEDSRLTAARLLATCSQRRPQDPAGVEWIVGAPEVRARTARLAAECQEEYLSLRPGQSPAFDDARTVDEDVLARGIESRSIVLDSVRNDRPAMACLRWEMGAGADVRTLPTLPARVRVFDRRYAVVSVSNLTGMDGALVVSSEAVVHSFVTLFSKLWAEAEPLGDCRPRRGDKLSPREVHILKLWAQGHTDASAARRMEVSLRTIRRLSDRLTERLGTTSRFQLGAVAIAKRLIDPAEIL